MYTELIVESTQHSRKTIDYGTYGPDDPHLLAFTSLQSPSCIVWAGTVTCFQSIEYAKDDRTPL